jgi:hypothetical protein
VLETSMPQQLSGTYCNLGTHCPMFQECLAILEDLPVAGCASVTSIVLLSETCIAVLRGESYCLGSLYKLSPHEIRRGAIEI